MKRIVIGLCICVLCIQATGCGAEEPTPNENIVNPAIDNNNSNADSIIYEGTELLDNYLVYEIGDSKYKVAEPNWRSGNSDVLSVGDAVHVDTSVGMGRQKAFGQNNMPSGMETDKTGIRWGLFWYRSLCTAADADSEKLTWVEQPFQLQKISGAWSLINIKEDKSQQYSYVIETADVECISFALYEGVYNDVPKLHISLYGITDDIFNKYLTYKDRGEGEKDYFIDCQDVYSEYMEGMCSLDILLDQDITESGNYYIDYTALQAQKAYKQMFYVLTFDHEPAGDYVFSIQGFQYNIKDKAQYEQWKQQNKALYLE